MGNQGTILGGVRMALAGRNTCRGPIILGHAQTCLYVVDILNLTHEETAAMRPLATSATVATYLRCCTIM